MKRPTLLTYAFYVLFFSISTTVSAKSPCVTHRVQHFEKKDVKVWSTTVCPNQYLPFHSHQYARVAISKESGDLDVIYKDGHTKKIHFEKNIPIYLSLAQGKLAHQDVNRGKIPLHITVIELKK